MNNTDQILNYIDLFNYHVMPIYWDTYEPPFLDNMIPWLELFKIKSFYLVGKTSTKAICNKNKSFFVIVKTSTKEIYNSVNPPFATLTLPVHG